MADFFAQTLQTVVNDNYWASPIPSTHDGDIDHLMRRWLSLSEFERAKAASVVTAEQQATLLTYAERVASRAVRENDRVTLLLGLIAQGLGNEHMDWRENILVIALLYDACVRVGGAPDHLFTESTRYLTSEVAKNVRSFLSRSSEDRSLKAMGFETSGDGVSFVYRRTWG